MVLYLALVHAGLLLILAGNYVYLRRRRARVVPAAYPPVSILIPARNEEDNLRRLLPSLLQQDYPDFEVIVYDDGSEDGTWQVLRAADDARLKALRGAGPPPGWVGKVHALYQAAQHAAGTLFLFLDADAELLDAGALRRLVERHAALPEASVMTGLVRLRGGGDLLVSLVPNAILAALPWPLVRPLPLRSLGALNGQCWMIDAAAYRRFAPHEHLKNEVLEDVRIGRYLKGEGVVPVLCDLQREVAVYMYPDYRAAWRGFRKNAYLILGGRPLLFALLCANFILTYVLAPLFWPGFLGSIYLLKGATDRLSGYPLWITLLAPVSFLLGTLLQIDSALSHWTGRVSWKGRRV